MSPHNKLETKKKKKKTLPEIALQNLHQLEAQGEPHDGPLFTVAQIANDI